MAYMQFQFTDSTQKASEGISRIHAMAFSPNNRRLAVAMPTRHFVHLYDDMLKYRERFMTKPREPGTDTYVVRAMVFSPDSTNLAIAQSDKAVFVYNLGVDWGDRKAIISRASERSEVNCVCWPMQRPEDLIYGVADGKVKNSNIKTGKPQTIYNADSPVVSLASSPDGMGLVSGHLDGTIWMYAFDEAGAGVLNQKYAVHPCPPYVLGWGEAVAAAGADCRVVFYDRAGSPAQRFEYRADEEKEFYAGTFNPAGHCFVVGSWDRFRSYNYNHRRERFEEGQEKKFEGLYTILHMAWKPDGTTLVMASLRGALDAFTTCIKRYRQRLSGSEFEFTYVSVGQVIVRRVGGNRGHVPSSVVLKSQYGLEITHVNVYKERFLVGRTENTLLLGDLNTCMLSEIAWTGGGNEKFFFENPQVCLVFNAGELILIEYGRNEQLAQCRTEFVSPKLISVRISEPLPDEMRMSDDRRKKCIAYLIDRTTIRIQDLVTGIPVATFPHEVKIDWLELNQRSTKLLFRDKHKQLFLYDVVSQTKSTLLSFCSFVQWVPGADVIVAQSRGDMCVWYSVDCPDRVSMQAIGGEIQEVERQPGRTEAVVMEGINSYAYPLLEPLIEFGAAMEAHDHDRACSLLEDAPPEAKNDAEGMWEALATASLRSQKLHIAERCAAALGDVARARAIRKIARQAAGYKSEQVRQGNATFDPMEDYRVQASLAILNKDFRRAEKIYLDRNHVKDAIAMWQELHAAERSIAVAVEKSHPGADNMREEYLRFLLEHRQEEKAGEIKEEDHRFSEAIELYIRGGLPARAARVIQDHNVQVEPSVLEAIASALYKGGMFERAGQFFEKLKMFDRAISAYEEGHAFGRAVELARREFPGQVTQLEESWGDWLVSQKQVDAAINHYIEANKYEKAIDAAISSRQWTKAVQILGSQDQADPTTHSFFRAIALHYEETHQYVEAEKYYLKADMRQEAVQMYVRIGHWDSAHKVASQHLSAEETQELYREQAKQFEVTGHLREAERLFIKIGDPDSAIKMYKSARMFDQMFRLVGIHRRKHLQNAQMGIAHQLQKEGHHRQAELYYSQAGEWQTAVKMYVGSNMWEDAVRVAKLNSSSAFRQVVFEWANRLGREAGTKLLAKHGLVEQAIDHAVEKRDFDQAIELAQSAMRSKLPHVFHKQGEFLEDEGKYDEAEDAFIKAVRPKEAIEMYLHLKEWAAAMRVAEMHDPPSGNDVREAHAKHLFDSKEYEGSESLMLQAQRPEKLCWWFQAAEMWMDALRVARAFCPTRLGDVNEAYALWLMENAVPDLVCLIDVAPLLCLQNADPKKTGKLFEESGDFIRAIDSYLKFGRSHSADHDEMVEVWRRAVSLCYNQTRDRLPDTMNQVAEKLMEIGRHKIAAEMCKDYSDYESAIGIYIKGDLWDEALALSDHAGNRELSDQVHEAYRLEMMRKQNAQMLIDRGLFDEGLEILAERAQWGEMIAQARRIGFHRKDILAKFSPRYIEHCLEDGDAESVVEGMTAAHMDGMSEDPVFFPVYDRLCRAATAVVPRPQWDHMLFKQALSALVRYIRQEGLAELAGDLVTLSIVHHHYATAAVCFENPELTDLGAKLMISLTRYANLVPSDKALYEAGKAAKEQNWNGTAFVMLDRFIEIYDYIDDVAADPTVDFPDEKDEFRYSDVPAELLVLPGHVVTPAEAEQMRSWVLAESIASNFERVAATRNCPDCEAEIHEASIECRHCDANWDPCVVTGYPCPPAGDANRVQCRACQAPALRDEWNRYMSAVRVCPWCLTSQSGFF